MERLGLSVCRSLRLSRWGGSAIISTLGWRFHKYSLVPTFRIDSTHSEYSGVSTPLDVATPFRPLLISSETANRYWDCLFILGFSCKYWLDGSINMAHWIETANSEFWRNTHGLRLECAGISQGRVSASENGSEKMRYIRL